ncbi:MAG: M23 family metallopeptidase [Alphaproteobacteria bacterium]|nr:M23 family metallopeptidase [Alphaproteobacteria bacterium]
MRLSAVAFLMILTTVFLSGCDKAEMAAVDDRSQNFYGRNGVRSLAAATSVALPVESHTVAAPVMAQRQAPAVPPMAATRWQWPVQGQVVEKFGPQSNGASSEGIVIAAPEGAPIHAAQSGEVAFVGEDARNYGNIVILRHADGTMASYAHASRIVVKKGAQVQGGSVIAYVGRTGNAAAPQLHFAVREGKNSVDPLSKLPQQVAMNY